jgi:hypothetical protein
MKGFGVKGEGRASVLIEKKSAYNQIMTASFNETTLRWLLYLWECPICKEAA